MKKRFHYLFSGKHFKNIKFPTVPVEKDPHTNNKKWEAGCDTPKAIQLLERLILREPNIRKLMKLILNSIKIHTYAFVFRNLFQQICLW